jgi:tRNA(Ile)-lysidine synthase
MLHKVKDTIDTFDMIKYKDHIVIGVSGGADSMSLLHVLYSMQQEYELKLTAVHIHHGLRGKEADEDADFVSNICSQYQIPYVLYRFDIGQEAKLRKLTEEEAGRMMRYTAFEEVLQKKGAQKIAVAHTTNDQAETLLMRLMRGTGLQGLGGIPPVRGPIIRPLIGCTREEVETYCKQYQVLFRNDSSNHTELYTRNKIRIHLIPWLQKELNPTVVDILNQTSILLQEEERYMDEQAQMLFEQVVGVRQDGESIELHVSKLLSVHPVMRKRILRKAILCVRESLKDIGFGHIVDMEGLLQKQTGKKINLPGKILVEKQYDILKIYKKTIVHKGYFYEIQEKSPLFIVELGQYVRAIVYPKENFTDFSHSVYTKTFDYDKIKNGIQIRTRLTGDRIQLRGNKKLKDFFIDEKVPRDSRDKVPLVTDGQQIIWVVGYGKSRAYEVDIHTKRVIQISFFTEILDPREDDTHPYS